MIHRCYNCREGSYEYHYYRGKGIKVCDEWRNNFESFEEWSLSHGFCEEYKSRKLSSSIDRIDPDGNYEPNNCRWITFSENCARARHAKTFKKRLIPKLRIEIEKPNGKALVPKYTLKYNGAEMALDAFKKYGMGTVVNIYDQNNHLVNNFEYRHYADILKLECLYDRFAKISMLSKQKEYIS